MKKNFTYLTTALCWLMSLSAGAQLSSNPDKFLGNITTGYNVDYGSEKFYTLWNQITPENETKWDAIEGGGRGNFNFGGADRAANYAKQHNFPFKYHTLIWGAQYPGWVNNLSTSEQTKAIVEYFDGVAKHFPNLEIIDVVNEAMPGHQPAPYKAALGGDGKTGYDWIIRAFELAHERWPDAILVYNDYNSFTQRSDYIKLVRTLRDAGAPIDAYGCQSHDLNNMSGSDFKTAMKDLQDNLKMPMYITEYDINHENDNTQKQRFMEQLPVMWEADYCAGVTIWGYIYGRTWLDHSGLIKDGKDRAAMTWLREYMTSEKAKTAKSPFPGMKKEASVYIKPTPVNPTKGEPMTITVNARLRTKTIEKVELYVNNKLYQTITEYSSINSKTKDAAYEAEYTPVSNVKYNLKAIVYDTEGNTYERIGAVTATNPRSTYKGEIELPGTVEAENFDKGGEGATFHDTNSADEGKTGYRNDGGVDIVTGNGGHALGYTANGEWLEYTIDVKETGIYSYDAYVSSGASSASFSLSVETDGKTEELTEVTAIPQTGNGNWDKYVAVHGRTLVSLSEGKHILRLNITGDNGNIDKFVFKHIDPNNDLKLTLTSDPKVGTINESATLMATNTSENTQSVSFYVNNQLVKTVAEAPFEATYKPTAKGTYNVTAESTDTDGKTSKVFKYSFKVNNKRSPYGTTAIAIPGTIEAERFDKGGEGLSFHDSDSKDEGDASNKRTDGEGVDLVKGNSGTVIGYTAVNEWLEYTINVKEAGKYSYEATVSSGTTNSGFRISLVNADGSLTTLANISVPQTANNDWGTYKAVTGNFLKELPAGQQILRFTITGANCNIDKVKLTCVEPNAINEVTAEPTETNGKKVFENGQFVIYRNGKRYNALGVELQ